MNRIYDIVVVGGGVSGLSAGLSASLQGAETLVVDRKKQIGVPVRCGEFFPAQNEADSLMPDSASFKRFYALLHKETICNQTKLIRVFSPRLRKYEFSFNGLVLRREIFERAIAERAENSGTTVLTSTSAETFEKKGNEIRILANTEKGEIVFKAKLVIGADGFPSRTIPREYVSSYIKNENLALCVQKTVTGAKVDKEVVEMYLGKKYAPGGYAWVIPKGDGEANVGVGARLTHLKKGKPIVDYMNAFTNENPNVSQYLEGAGFSGLVGKTLPVGGLSPYLYGEGRLLVGDAAGLVIATNGSGIPTALASGSIAGQVAARHMKEGLDLSVYEDELRKEIGKPLMRSFRYRQIGDFFMRSDEALERLMQTIGTGGIAKVIRAEPIKPFFF